MTPREQQRHRLRTFNLQMRGIVNEVVGPDLARAAPDTSIDGQILEESIILRTARPVLAIKHNETELLFHSQGDKDLWKEPLAKAKEVLDTAIRAVGRVEVKGHAMSWLGTGWLVAPDVLVTNRHVALEFATSRDATFMFRTGPTGPMSASVDFLRELDNEDTLEFSIRKILHIEADPGPDLAFLEVAPTSGGKRLACPVPLSKQKASVTAAAAVVGYPARDSRIPDLDLMLSTFGDVFDKKRLAPGAVISVSATDILHNCSTLGGNSGSVVVDLDRGEAIGLHFSGRFLQANYAVRADVVQSRLERLRSANQRVFLSEEVHTTRRESSSRAEEMTLTIPLVISLSLGRPTPAVAVSPPAPVSASRADPMPAITELSAADYADRRGYVPDFLGEGNEVDLPLVGRARDLVTFESADGTETVLRYQHFSVVMSKSRRMCVFSAVNIDGGLSRKTQRAAWRWDPRIPRDLQIMNECYGSPPKFSRGHMTRREDPAWGSAADAARGNEDSMHVTNTTPQMQAFNSPIWLGLEDYALQNARADKMRVSVFTGPLFSRHDPEMHGVRIPSAFWKVIAFIHDESGELCATGYSMKQDAQITDAEFVYGQYTSRMNQTTQVPLRWIEERAQLTFGELADRDPLGAQLETIDPYGGLNRPSLASFDQVCFVR